MIQLSRGLRPKILATWLKDGQENKLYIKGVGLNRFAVCSKTTFGD
jgi:hypothetical protein